MDEEKKVEHASTAGPSSKAGKGRTLLKLLFATLKVGTFSFGGGLAMLPFIEREFVENNKWMAHEEMADIFGLAQVVPGPIVVNVSVIAGFRIAKIPGVLMAVVGTLFPSIAIMILVTIFYQQFQNNKYVMGALRGISAAVVALLITAAMKLGQGANTRGMQSILPISLAIAAFVLTLVFGVSAMWLILGGAVIGVVIALIKRRIRVRARKK